MDIGEFIHNVQASPGKPALVTQNGACTYARLLEGQRRWCDVLDTEGLCAGTVIGLTGDCCPEMVSLLLALVERNMTAVPVLTGSDEEVAQALETAAAHGVFTFDASDAVDAPGRWRVLPQQPLHQAPNPLMARLHRDGARPGLILFTSGSSGRSKAALHDFSRIWSRCARGSRKAGTTLAFLKIDHIGGINTLLHVLLGGGTAVFPQDRSVQAVCRAIQEHRVELLPTTPTFLNMLLLSSYRESHDLSSLRMVTYGTEPMPQTTLLGLRQALPAVRCKQTYGMTETGILPTRSESDDSLWLQLGGPGFETRVLDDILWIRAETSMLGYLNAPSPFDAQGWLNTGDLVESRDGALRILGRQSEVINVGGEKVSPSEIEDVILQVDNIEEVVVRHKANPLTGHVVVATVRTCYDEDDRAVAARVRAHCQQHLSPYKVPALIQVTRAELMGRRFKKIRQPDLSDTIDMELAGVG